MPFLHTTSSGNVFLGGDYLQLGISAWGSLGVVSGLPSGFVGDPGVSFHYDPDGFGVGTVPPILDSTTPYTPEDRITFGYKTATSTNTASNAFLMGMTQISTTTTDTSSASLLSATTTGTMGQLAISQVVSFHQGDRYFKTTVTVTNTSSTETMTDVRFMRSFDPDHPKTTTNTQNDVVSQGGTPGTLATVQAVDAATGSPIILVSNDTRARASAYGFSNTDPYAPEAWTSPVDPNGASADIAIGLTFKADTLAPGQSATFEYYTVLDATVNLTSLFDPQPPSIANLGPAPTFVEAAPAILLDTDVDISDPDLDSLNGGLGDYGGATLFVKRVGGASTDDVLDFDPTALAAAGISISGIPPVVTPFIATSYDSLAFGANGILGIVFQAGATSAQVDALVRAISYANSSSLPPGSVQLEYTFSAGPNGGAGGATGSLTVNIIALNTQAPTISALGPAALHQVGQAATFIDPDNNANLADAELDHANNYAGATLTISRTGGASVTDSFSFDTARLSVAGLRTAGGPASGQIELISNSDDVASWTLSGGTLTLTFGGGVTAIATSAIADTILRSLKFASTDATLPGSVSLDVVFSDGQTNPAPLSTSTTLVVPVNTPPILSTPTDLTLSENALNAASVLLAPTITVADGTSTNFDGGFMSLVFDTSIIGDRVGIRNEGTDAGQIGYNTANGQITYGGVVVATKTTPTFGSGFAANFNANATPEAVQAILRNITYQYIYDLNPPATPRQFLFQIQDGDGATGVATMNVTLTPDNDPAQIMSLTSPQTFTTYGGARVIDNDWRIFDPDKALTIFDIGADFSGMSITFSTSSATGGSEFDKIFFLQQPGGLVDDTVNQQIKFPPTDSVTPDAVIATYTRTVLPTGVSVTYTFVPGTPDFMVIGVMRLIAYDYTGDRDNPPPSVTLNVSVNDASGAPNAVTSQDVVLNIIRSYPPVITENINSQSFAENYLNSGFRPIAPFVSGAITISDLDNNFTGGELRFHWAGGGQPYDQLAIINTGFVVPPIIYDDVSGTLVRAGGSPGSIDPLGGDNVTGRNGGDLVVRLSSNATPAAIADIIRSLGMLSYDENPTTPRQLEITVTDNAGLVSNVAGWTISITPENDAPIILNLDASTTYSGAPVHLDSDVAAYDLEFYQRAGHDQAGLVVTVSSVSAAGGSIEDRFAFATMTGYTVDELMGEIRQDLSGNVVASFSPFISSDNAGLFIVFVNNGTPPDITIVSEVLRGITYSYAGDPLTAPASVDVVYEVNDGASQPNSIVSQTMTVVFGPPNAPPEITALDGTRNLSGGATVIDTDVAIFDAEKSAAGDYSGVIVTLTTASATGGSIDDIVALPAAVATYIMPDSGEIVIGGTRYGTFTSIVDVGGLTFTITFAALDSVPVSQAVVDEVMHALTYSHAGGPPPPSNLLTVTVNDGSGAVNSVASSAIELLAANSAPVISGLDASRVFPFGESQVDPDVAVTDFELDSRNGGSGDYRAATFTLTTSSLSGGSEFDDLYFETSATSFTTSDIDPSWGQIFDSSSNYIGDYFRTVDVGGLTFSILFSVSSVEVSTALVDEILRSLTYVYNGPTTPSSTVTLSLSFDDGAGEANSVTTEAIVLYPLTSNNSPVISGLDATRSTTGFATVIDSNVSVTDADAFNIYPGGNYAGTHVRLTAAAVDGGSDNDAITFTTGPAAGFYFYYLFGGLTGYIVETSTNLVLAQFTRQTGVGGIDFSVDFTNGSIVSQALFDEILRSLTLLRDPTLLATPVTLHMTVDDGSGQLNALTTSSIVLAPAAGTRIVDYSTGSDNNLGGLVQGVEIDVPTGAAVEDPYGLPILKAVSNIITPVGTGVVYSLTDNFIITGTEWSDTIVGGDGNDIIRGGLNPDGLVGGGGNDIFYANPSESYADFMIDGGDGTDTLRVDGGADYRFTNLSSIEAIQFTANTSGYAYFMSEAVGNGLALATTVSTEGTADTSNGLYFVMLGDADATLDLRQFLFDLPESYFVQVSGTDAGETIYGAIDQWNTIISGGGADHLFGQGANDYLWGGLGNDVMTGGGGGDLFERDDNDTTAAQADEITDFTVGPDIISLYQSNSPASWAMLERWLLRTSAADGIGPGDAMLIGKWDGNVQSLRLDGVAADRTSGSFVSPLTASSFAFDTSTTSRIVTGSSGDDMIFGGLGLDTLTGGTGADTLVGDDGNDIIDGGLGTDSVDGGSASDTLIGGLGNDNLTGGANSDTFVFDAFDASATQLDMATDFSIADGDKVQFRLNGPASEEVLRNYMLDALHTGAGLFYTWWNGREQSLTLTGVTAAQLSSANFVFDTSTTARNVTGTALGDVLFGGLGNDSLTGGAGDDLMIGDAGNDTLVGGAGSNRYEGGAGADRFDGTGSTSNRVDYNTVGGITLVMNGAGVGGAGSLGEALGDTFVNIQSIRATSSGDVITLDTTVDVVMGMGGDDSITGSSDINDLQGGDGNDTLVSGGGNDMLTGGTGDDTIIMTGTYTLAQAVGGIGKDSITGGAFADNLRGGDGDDTILSGGGNDQLYGDAGNDTITISGTYTRATAYGGDGADTITGGGFADVLYGGNGNDSVSGGAGNDQLYGDAGNDTLVGGDGADVFYGGDGADSVSGGAGNDIINDTDGLNGDIYDGGADVDVLNYASTGTLDFSAANASADLLTNIDWVKFSASGVSVRTDDHTIGWAAGGGNDTLVGNAGAQWMQGGDGNDVLYGKAGGDRLEGGNGNDTICGGAGADYLTGGAGADLFVFHELIAGELAGNDGIADFNAAAGDILGFDTAMTLYTVGGTLPTSSTSAYLLYDQSSGQLYIDQNGATAGGLVAVALLAGAPTLTQVNITIAPASPPLA